MKAQRRPRAFWKRLLDEADRAGAVAPVAERHGVGVRTLSWWRLKHDDKRERAISEEPMLLPVVVRDAAHAPAEVEIAVGTVVIRAGHDVEYIASLVAALRARC